MSGTAMKLALIGALILLVCAAWVVDNQIADALFIFAAFSIGGVWGKQTGGPE